MNSTTRISMKNYYICENQPNRGTPGNTDFGPYWHLLLKWNFLLSHPPEHVAFECEMTFWMAFKNWADYCPTNPNIPSFAYFQFLIICQNYWFYDKIFSRKIFDITILLSILIQCKSLLGRRHTSAWSFQYVILSNINSFYNIRRRRW